MPDSTEMDQWISAYLSEWCEYFSDEPDASPALQLNATLLAHLHEWHSGQADTQNTAVAMIAAVKEQKDASGSLDYVEAILFEAAEASPLSPRQLAQLVVSLCEQLHDQGDAFKHSIAGHANESLNGPEMPSSAGAFYGQFVSSTPPAAEDELRCIQRWSRLNEFVAHLALSQVCGDIAYLMPMFVLDPTFLSGPNNKDIMTKRELNYFVPAAAAWIEILGKDVYAWSVAAGSRNVTEQDTDALSLFTSEKWRMWKEGFRLYGMDAQLSDGAQRKANDAWREMCRIEGDPGEAIT